MQLVIDANVLLAAFGKSAFTRELLLHPRLSLFAPEHLLIETRKHLDRNGALQRRIGLPRAQITALFEMLTGSIETVAFEDYNHQISEALQLAAHHEDAPYLALALWKRMPLWSNDKGMKNQSKVKVFTTAQLISQLS